MGNKLNTIESLVSLGILGATIGDVLSKDKEDGAIIGALVGVAIAATTKASEDAKKTKVTHLVEEEGELYEVNSSGEKRFIRKLRKATTHLPVQFKLS